MIVKITVPQRFQLKMAAGFGDVLFRRPNDVHYIGGTEVLPPPLGAGAGEGTAGDVWKRRRRKRPEAF